MRELTMVEAEAVAGGFSFEGFLQGCKDIYEGAVQFIKGVGEIIAAW